jgi:hypothetical protein
LHNQGLFAAARGDAAALEWVAEIENVPAWRASARRVRMAYELMHGNVEAADALRRRAELFALEDGAATMLPGTSTRLELTVYSHTDDVIGVKRTMERLENMAQRFPGWQPTWQIARSQYLRIQGDLDGALTALRSSLEATAPGRHIDWGLAAMLHVALLNVMGRSPEAAERGLGYIADCEREQLEGHRLALLRVVGEALTRISRLPEALRMLDEHIALHEAQGTRGLQLGLAHEARARVAIANHDEAGVRHHAQLCAQEYKGARNPALSSKYKGLMREAESAGLLLTTGVQQALATSGQAVEGERSGGMQSADHTLSSRMLGCVDRAERAREGLRVLVESTGAAGGFLFDIAQGSLSLLASIEEGAPSAALLQMCASCGRGHSQDPDDAATTMELEADPVMLAFTDPSGRLYEPMVLTREHQPMLLAVLRYATVERCVPRSDFLDAMIEALSDDAPAHDHAAS